MLLTLTVKSIISVIVIHFSLMKILLAQMIQLHSVVESKEEWPSSFLLYWGWNYSHKKPLNIRKHLNGL